MRAWQPCTADKDGRCRAGVIFACGIAARWSISAGALGRRAKARQMRHILGFWPFILLLAALLLVFAPASARPLEPRHVRTGVFITSISDLEPADGSFRLTGYIWFNDPAARFDPRHSRILARTLAVTATEQKVLPDGSGYSTAYFDAVIDLQFDVTRYPSTSNCSDWSSPLVSR